MPRIGNKTNIISLRCDDEFIEKLNKLQDKFHEHAGDNITYSKILRLVVEYVSKLDLDNKKLFIDIFHQYIVGTFKNDI